MLQHAVIEASLRVKVLWVRISGVLSQDEEGGDGLQ